MKHLRTYILPIAIILGFIFHNLCDILKVFLPYLIFLILFLNFVAVDIRKMRFRTIYLWLLLFQVGVSVTAYCICSWLHLSEIISHGVLMGVICPVAASVVVVACLLGANRETVTSYTIIDNMVLSLLIPLIFSFVGHNNSIPFSQSFLIIISRVGTVIGLPFVIALVLHFLMPNLKQQLAKFSSCTFYIWAVAFFITIGQTIGYLFAHGKGNEWNVFALAILSLFFCVVQFYLGKKLGRRYGDVVAGAQLMGQKNTAMGIWIANTFLNPLASLFLAFYSIWQNLFNSWQIYRHDKKMR